MSLKQTTWIALVTLVLTTAVLAFFFKDGHICWAGWECGNAADWWTGTVTLLAFAVTWYQFFSERQSRAVEASKLRKKTAAAVIQQFVAVAQNAAYAVDTLMESEKHPIDRLGFNATYPYDLAVIESLRPLFFHLPEGAITAIEEPITTMTACNKAALNYKNDAEERWVQRGIRSPPNWSFMSVRNELEIRTRVIWSLIMVIRYLAVQNFSEKERRDSYWIEIADNIEAKWQQAQAFLKATAEAAEQGSAA